MRKLLLMLGFLLILLNNAHFTGLAYGQTADEQREWAKEEYARIPKINAQAAYAMFQAGKMIIIDAGPPNRFKTQHCFRAYNIPETVIDRIKVKFPKKMYFGIY